MNYPEFDCDSYFLSVTIPHIFIFFTNEDDTSPMIYSYISKVFYLMKLYIVQTVCDIHI